MRAYKVAIGYAENVQGVPEFQTIATVKAENPEAAAVDVSNGLEPEDSENAVLQVQDVITGKYKYFTF